MFPCVVFLLQIYHVTNLYYMICFSRFILQFTLMSAYNIIRPKKFGAHSDIVVHILYSHSSFQTIISLPKIITYYLSLLCLRLLHS